jgi:cytochrome bd-type quinol oxidase subunit 2
MTASNLFAVSLWLIYLAIVVFCLWRLVTSRRSAAERVLWALVVLLLPVIGPILFLWGFSKTERDPEGG